ncbi:MAG: FkbM family methyltransferase [Methylorubrum rhodinum]|uniref:FkbM family methyltransferase n=1 Tax=Methylorubrum rhodinum TaxID=29428 RepID=UPI003BB1B4DC
MPASHNPFAFRHLTGLDVRVKVVDVGANPIDGAAPYAGLVDEGSAEVVGFEPNLEALARLDAMKGPHETYLPHAVGDGGRHTLHICRQQGMSSLLTPDPAVLACFLGFPVWGEVIETREVDTVRLDDVPATAGLDYLKIDIQGGELMVFRNALARLSEASVIHTEVEFVPLYAGQPLFSDVDQFLRAQGFVFHRFHPDVVSRIVRPLLNENDVYAPMSQAVWADALFIRDFTRPELLTERQLLSTAKILHDCYQSFDICARLLQEHDRRHGGRLLDTYLTGLHRAAGRQAA